MKTISRYIMTLALLLTAVTGAWAAETVETTLWEGTCTEDGVEINSTTVSEFNAGDVLRVYVTIPEGGANFKIVYKGAGNDWTETAIPSAGSEYLWINDGETYKDVTFTVADITALTGMGIYIYKGEQSTITKVTLITPAASEPTIDVTTNAASEQDLFTEASFNMSASDVTVNYTLVRDMQDEANLVAFSGLPTNDEPIVVKKGDDGKYQPAEALTIQLIDPLAAAEAQNIIAADGITVKVLVGDDSSLPIEYDHYSPITLENFLADMKPGYYWIKAEQTDENSPYDGTVYSSEFTVVEQYDLTVKPANDFSKGKIESVTVGSESVTIDANTGKATKTGIAPETEVKIKAKRGYVIDKVEVKKAGPALKTLTVTGVTIYYAEGDTWQQAIERPENAGSGWKVQGNYIFNVGLTLFTNGGGATYVYVRPGDTIDATKNYSLEAD